MASGQVGDSIDLRENVPGTGRSTPQTRQEYSEQHKEHVQHRPRMVLSKEEMRVLQECNRESFYYRCVPVGTAAMILTHFAVKAGYLRGSPKYGSLFKVLGAGFTGYLIGKFSYRSKCEEKIMRLPNSQIAESLRRRKQGLSPFPEIYTMDPAYSKQGDAGPVVDRSTLPDSDPEGSWDIDEDKNVQFRGLSDSGRPTMDNSDSVKLGDDLPQQPATSYELLRQQNRDDYEARRTSIYQRKDSPTPSGPRFPTRPDPSSDNVPRFNQYGDVME